MTDFPPVLRWTANTKRDLVERIARGDLDRDEALRHYRISAEEFAIWQRDYPARPQEVAR